MSVSSRWVLAGVLAYGPLMLFVDSHTRNAWPDQFVLGLVTLGALWFFSRWLPPRDRGVVWVCAAVSTGFEAMGSLVWGAYHYRFGGIPFFVPFGHGLIYVFGLTLASTEFVRRNERRFCLAILAVAALWAVGGLTALPWLTGRVDVHGFVWLPLFAYVLIYSPRRAFFAALFIATTDVELFGTWFHSWMWLPQTPWLHVASGNPPSAIAGGYAIIDGTVLVVAELLRGLRSQLVLRREFAP